MIYKEIKGYEGLYAASVDGHIVSLRGGRHIKLKPFVNTGGYLRVNLIDSRGRMTHHYVHRLVAAAFLPNPKNYREVDHLNSDRQDNRVTNLRWCDRNGNVRSALSAGRWSKKVPVTAVNLQTGETRHYPFLRYASRDLFGNNYSLAYLRKQQGTYFEKNGWLFKVVEDEICTA